MALSRHQEELANKFPVGERVSFRQAEGAWDQGGFHPTGRSLTFYGVVERSATEEDREAGIIRLDTGDAERISLVNLTSEEGR
mgnify:CR=1 FL=1